MNLLPGEQSLLDYISTIEAEGLSNTEHRIEKFHAALKFFRGEQWRDQLPKYRVGAVYNFFNQVIDRKTALLTDAKPAIEVVAVSGGNDRTAEILTKICRSIWQSEMMDLFLMEVIQYNALAGASFADVWIDRETAEPKISVVDPRYIAFDPLVLRPQFLDQGEYVITWKVMPLSQARSLYSNRAEDIQPDYTGEDVRRGFGIGGDKDSLVQRIRRVLNVGRYDEPNPKKLLLPRCWVRQVWIKDRSKDGKGAPIYPGGRFIKVVGGVVVEDMPNPYIDNRFPFEMMNWYPDPDGAWGMSEYDVLSSPQEVFNKVLSSLVDNVIAINNQIWIGDYNALTEKEWNALANVPGAKIRIRPGTQLRRDSPPPLPPHIFSFLQFGMNAMEILSGITEVMQGRRAGQLVSGVAIEQLQAAAQTTIRLKARQLESFLSRIGQKLIARIFQAFTVDRVFRIIGPEGRPEVYNFKRAELMRGHESPSRAVGSYQFLVEPGSTLRMIKWQKMLLASQLYQMGLIDEEEMLKAADYPNREEILKRIQEKQMAAATLGMEGAAGPRATKLPQAALRSPYSQELPLQQPVSGGPPA